MKEEGGGELKIKLLILLVLSLSILSGCGKPSVREDLSNYVNRELPKITGLEDEAVAEYNSVSGENYKNDGIMYDALINTIIPKYKKFIDGLEKINPKTTEVKKVHKLYLDGANEQYKGFVSIKTAIEKQNIELITEANNHLEAGRNGIDSFLRELNDLADKYNVDI